MRDDLTVAQVAEAQRRSAAFVPRKNPGESIEYEGDLDPPALLRGDGWRSSATGFFITSNGFILTAAHVVSGGDTLKIQTAAGLVAAKVVTSDPINDVAILKVQGSFPPLSLGGSRVAKLGSQVFTMGFANVHIQGVSLKLTKVEISSLAGIQDDPRHFQITVPVQPGNSGGPLVDMAFL